MAEFDVRTEVLDKIDVIRFSDDDTQVIIHSGSYVKMADETKEELYLASKEHAQNLIKALQKAIELGWFDK